MAGAMILALSLSIDALGIGVSYGTRDVKIPISARLVIFFLGVFITGLSVFFGTILTGFLPEWVSKYLGILLLMFMGTFIIIQSFRPDTPKKVYDGEKTLFNFIIKSMGITIKIIKTPLSGDLDDNNMISPKEAFYVGTALSIDSIGAGIASAAMGLNSILIPLFTGIFQVLFLSFGLTGGKKLTNFLTDSKKLVRLSGIILILLSIIRLFY